MVRALPKAKVFAERAYAARLYCEGEDSPDNVEVLADHRGIRCRSLSASVIAAMTVVFCVHAENYRHMMETWGCGMAIEW